MKKSLTIVLSAMLLSPVCFAEQAPVAQSTAQGKAVENKQKDINKKSVKPSVKKTGKKARKETETSKK